MSVKSPEGKVMKRFLIIRCSDSAIVIAITEILLRRAITVCRSHVVIIYRFFKTLLKTAVTIIVHCSEVVHRISVAVFNFALKYLCNEINYKSRQWLRFICFA